MSSNVVNLNRFRKKKQREEKAKQAEINRIRHGRTQGEKERERTERERATRLLEARRLETAAESVGEDGRELGRESACENVGNDVSVQEPGED